jgi:hypothetical protein
MRDSTGEQNAHRGGRAGGGVIAGAGRLVRTPGSSGGAVES